MKNTNAITSGRISVNPRGFGFLTYDLDQTAFVSPPDLNPFLDGDIVSANVVEGSPGRWNATNLVLLERTRTQLFGSVILGRGSRPYLKVDRLVSNTDWPLDDSPLELEEALFVIANIEGERAVPVRIIETEAELALMRCVVRHGIRSEFSEALLTHARLLNAPPKLEHRRDLREVPTVTIDAPSTTDIDDALSALPPEPDGALRVLVSIADVDAVVSEGSDLDLEARQRATSVYLAGMVLPMLPDVLSSQAVSLLPGVDRLTLTAELRIDSEGGITSVDVYESMIRSAGRVSYEEMSDFLLGQGQAGAESGPVTIMAPAIADTLRRLRTAAARLSQVRAARGGVELASEEAYVSFDPTTRLPTGVEPRGETMAHRIVERLMVAANEAIATWLVDRGQPALYRTHAEPSGDKLRELSESAAKFGLEAGFGPRLSPRGLAAFEAQYRGSEIAPAMRMLLGRTLGPATYTPVPDPHFGLGAPLYLHFTSPIRRYADLVVHRIVKSYLHGDRSLSPEEPKLQELAGHLNALTWKASKAEAERHRMLIARIFKDRIGETVRGNIVAIRPFGIVMQMIGTGATGTISSDALPNGPYRYDGGSHKLVGPSQTFAIGDFLQATVVSSTEELGRVELALTVRYVPEEVRPEI
jgi:ribonuclease R